MNNLNPPGVSFPDPSYVGELYEEDDIVYTWTGDRWIVWGGTDGSPGVTQDYVDKEIDELEHEIKRDYLTTSDANKTYLRDGFTSNKLCINRTGGGSIDSMKVTAITGGASIWRLDCKAGKGGPVIYQTEGDSFHKFIGKAYFQRGPNEKQGFCIEGRTTNGDIRELFYVYHNSGSVADAVNYTGKITSPNNIVNKEYVDNAVGTGSAGAEVIRPAQLSWKFEGDTENKAPAEGCFRRTSSSGNTYLRFSFISSNGCDLGDGKFEDTNVSFSDGPVGTIWESRSGRWKLKKQFRVASWRWNYTASGDSEAHFEFKLSTDHGRDWDEFTAGTDYFVTVGGFF